MRSERWTITEQYLFHSGAFGGILGIMLATLIIGPIPADALGFATVTVGIIVIFLYRRCRKEQEATGNE